MLLTALKTRRWQLLLALMVALLSLAGWLGYQNYQATHKLHTAQQLDTAGHYASAAQQLQSINQLGVWPGLAQQIRAEQRRNQNFQQVAQKLAQAQQLLRQHNPAAAAALLQGIGDTGSTALQSQVAQLQQTTHGQTTSPTTNTTTKSGSSTSSGGSTPKPSPTPAPTPAPTPTPTPAPPSPMTAISITNFSPAMTPGGPHTCILNEYVTFSVNGSGSVKVTWQELSTKTSSGIENPYTYSFSAAGSQTDHPPASTPQGLESGDSYRISVTITDTANPSISVTSGPAIFSTCASPQPLQSPQRTSFLSSPLTPVSLTASQNQDSVFVNMCEMNVQATFSAGTASSVQVVYTITSASAIGATLYSLIQQTFSGPGTATDSSYIRMPHLPSGLYTITAKANVLGDPAHSTTFAPITSGCD